MKRVIIILLPVLVITFTVLRCSTPPSTGSEQVVASVEPVKSISNGSTEITNSSPSQVITNFRKMSQRLLKQLPTVAQMRKSPNYDPHLGIEGTMQGGEVLGTIATSLKSDYTLIPEGLKFYSTCAQDKKVLSSIRAVCFRNLKDWNEKLSDKTKIDDKDYPADTVRLADELPRD